MTTETYLITAISNLHAGSGDADFGIIDKHVQRDPTTNLPIVFASSIKGAMREAFNGHADLRDQQKAVFGSDNKDNDLQQGNYHFYDAHLLALPVRSSHHFYYLATCPALIKDFIDKIRLHSYTKADSFAESLEDIADFKVEKGKPKYLGDNANRNIEMEDWTATTLPKDSLSETSVAALHQLLEAHNIALFNSHDFKELADNLPTVARNSLEDGISNNLWYEEIVPRESRFYCCISRPESGKDAISAGLKTMNNTLQIGANATVGFGWCKMTKC